MEPWYKVVIPRKEVDDQGLADKVQIEESYASF